MLIAKKVNEYYSNPEFAQKLGYPTNPRMAQALGLYPYFIPIDHSEGTEILIGTRRLIMIGSNNYLGLTTHPKVKRAAIQAIEKYGTSCTGSRFLNGTLDIHLELEERLAALVEKEKALAFSTGYQTNLGVFSSILGRKDVVVVDKDIHASIIDAISLAKGQNEIERRVFRHNNFDDLASILSKYENEGNKLVAIDGVYSMRGDIAPVPEIASTCQQHQAMLLVDDAHGIGVLGGGRGTAHHFGCTQDVDLIMGTFSKSFASLGGFIAGSKEMIHWIQHFARSFIFSASLCPPNVATVLACLDIMNDEPERIARLNKIADTMREELRLLGFDVGHSQTPIVPVIIGDHFKTLQAWEFLFRNNVYANVALPPAVPSKGALLRTSYIASHTDEQLERVLDVFKSMKSRIRIEHGIDSIHPARRR